MNRIVIQILGETHNGRFVPASTLCEFALECQSFVIGSQPTSTPHVRIDSPTVSRRHLIVDSVGGDRWRLRDTGTDNGTIQLEGIEENLFDDDWQSAGRRISELETEEPVVLLIGEVVVRLVPVGRATAIPHAVGDESGASA